LIEEHPAAAKKPSLHELRAFVRVSIPVMLLAAIGLATVDAENKFITSLAWAQPVTRCQTGQGYLFSRPMPASEVAEWIAKHPPQQAAAA
jgi:hypothetical protein